MSSATVRAAAGAAVGMVVALVTGCSTAGHGSARTPHQALLAASRAIQSESSLSATESQERQEGAGAPVAQLTGSLQQLMGRSPLIGARIESPGGSEDARGSVVIVPTASYVEQTQLAQLSHSARPWMEVPFSEVRSSPAISEAVSKLLPIAPVAVTRVLAADTEARMAGKSVIDGVPTTEYAGPVSVRDMDSAEIFQGASSSLEIAFDYASSLHFEIWIDGHNLPRKIVLTEGVDSGGTGSLKEVIVDTVGITSYNQPVTFHVPPPAETYVVPASHVSGQG